MNVIDMYYY